MKVCKNCGSDEVFHDAYVGVNDTSDIRIFFETIDCFACGDRDIDVVEA